MCLMLYYVPVAVLLVLPFEFKEKRLPMSSLLAGIEHETAVQAYCCAVLSAEYFHYCSQLIMDLSRWL